MMFCHQVQFPVNIFGILFRGDAQQVKICNLLGFGPGMEKIFILYSTCLDSLEPRHLNKAFFWLYLSVCVCVFLKDGILEKRQDLLLLFIRLH